MATIKDVAREAGVSVATVSNYLNRTTPVSKKRAKAIQDAIDRLKYSHNMLARNVRTRRNLDIGVILPDLDDSYYVQLFQGIKSYFQNTDYTVNVEFSRNIPEFERNIAESFLKKQVCGLFLISCQPDDWKFYYDNFTSRNIPLVLLDRNVHNLDTNFVSFDYYGMTRKLTEELLQNGNREIYLVTGPTKYTCESECVRGFADACEAYGVEFSTEKNVQTDMSKENAFRKITNLLKDKNLDAVVTTTESISIGVMEGLTVLKGDISDEGRRCNAYHLSN